MIIGTPGSFNMYELIFTQTRGLVHLFLSIHGIICRGCYSHDMFPLSSQGMRCPTVWSSACSIKLKKTERLRKNDTTADIHGAGTGRFLLMLHHGGGSAERISIIRGTAGAGRPSSRGPAAPTQRLGRFYLPRCAAR
jgi:hypothetical protein